MNFGSPKVCRGLAAECPRNAQAVQHIQKTQKKKEISLQTSTAERKTRGNALPLPSLQGYRLVSDSRSSFAGTPKQQHDLNGKCVSTSSEKHIYDEEVWRACLFHPWVAGENIYHHSPLHR